MPKNLLAISILLALYIEVSAQLPKSILKPVQRVSVFDDYDGTIYERLSYKISYVTDEISGNYTAELRYNIYTDAIEYKSDSNVYELNKRNTLSVRIEDDYFYYCEFRTDRGLKRDGYYVLVELNDTYRIYKKYELIIKEPQQNTMTQLSEPGSIKQTTTYYLEERGTVVELPMKKKDLLSIFSDKENELEEYMKKEKIRLKKEEDLIRLVARYNAIKNMDDRSSKSLLSNKYTGN